MNISEGAAFGAALLAGVGAQVYSDVESACASAIPQRKPNLDSEETQDLDD